MDGSRIRTVPASFVVGQTVEQMALEVIEEWKRIDPVEVSAWRKEMVRHRQAMSDEKGFTQTRELMSVCKLPMFVSFRMGQKLGDPGWISHDWRALQAVLAVLPEARLNQTTGTKLNADA